MCKAISWIFVGLLIGVALSVAGFALITLIVGRHVFVELMDVIMSHSDNWQLFLGAVRAHNFSVN